MSVETREQSMVQQIIDNVETVVVGKREAVELAMVAILADGHILLEDVPGVGKTMLARTLAQSLNCSFHRIQFTPDLLPSDITGVSVYNQKTTDFEFRPGPILTQVLLADEINRATPRTQSALLEAMEERQLTVDGTTYVLPKPFLVMATQNPIEYEGTFPLPEAQLDRFLLRIVMGYPEPDDELEVLKRQRLAHPLTMVEPVTDAEELQQLQAAVRLVHVDSIIENYVVELVGRTRHHPDIALGASPRGSLGLIRAAQALALMHGRQYVLPDDVKKLAIAILSHRIIVRPESSLRGCTSTQILKEILGAVPVVLGDAANA